MTKAGNFTAAAIVAFMCAAGLTNTQAAPGQDDAERADLKRTHQFKEFSWVDSRSGDCHLSGILTIFDHGYAIWTASSKTDSSTSGDIWHEELEVLDAQKRRLFGFGVWDSPRMFPGSQYNWRKTDSYPRGFFDQADSATSAGDC
jgi:hypothetical protein